jgi:hypothetical protein
MQQTKPAFFLDCAGFAADPRCSTDSDQASVVDDGPLGVLDGERNSHGLMLSYGNGRSAFRTPHRTPRAITGQAAAASCTVTDEGSPSASLRTGLPEEPPPAWFVAGSSATVQLHPQAGWAMEEGCPSRTSRAWPNLINWPTRPWSWADLE